MKQGDALFLALGFPFARQRWRAWIETMVMAMEVMLAPSRSPVSDGGRGLKRGRRRSCCGRSGSPVSDGGRGLKQRQDCRPERGQPFARQRWRAWIETTLTLTVTAASARSPVSDGGRGLKQAGQHRPRSRRKFARQRWRAWIETCSPTLRPDRHAVRPSAMAGVD